MKQNQNGTHWVFIGCTGTLCQFTQRRLKTSNQLLSTTSNYPAAANAANIKWPIKLFKVIQGHVCWGQWKGDKGLNNTNTNNTTNNTSFPMVPKTQHLGGLKIHVFDYPTVV